MKISTKGEYGLRAMLFIAMRETAGPVTSHEIAAQQSIPEPYLRQILACLSKGGLVRSSRGPQGGYSLARPGAEITLKEILLTLEGRTTSVDQILALPCNIELGTQHCSIREVLLEVKTAVDQVLGGVDLETLASRQRQIVEQGIEIPWDVPGSEREASGPFCEGDPSICGAAAPVVAGSAGGRDVGTE